MKPHTICSSCVAALAVVFLLVVASDAPAQTYVFGRGADRTLIYSQSDPDGWSRWQSLAGTPNSAPDACSWGPDRVDVFVRGTDNALYQIARIGNAWTGWFNLGGTISSGPSAVCWGPNRMDVVAQGADGTTIHKAWDGARWTDWVSLGGQTPAGSAPDLASPGVGKLDVFTRGADNALWHKSYDNGRWNDWVSLGGQLNSDPAAVSWGDNRIDVFALGADNAMWHTAWTGASWSTWVSLGGRFAPGSAPDAASARPNYLEVFARGTDNAMWRNEWNGSRWSDWRSLAGQFTSDPGAVAVRAAASSVATPVASVRAPSARARFRVKLNGFMVNHSTIDDMLNRDGWADEVHLVMPCALLVDKEGVVITSQACSGVFGPIYGQRDDANREYRAGGRTDTGGLDTGNSFPSQRGSERAWTGGGRPSIGLGIPGVLFEGEIIRGETAAAVVPTLWEWDPPTEYYQPYAAMLRNPELPLAISRFIIESPGTGLSEFIRRALQIGVPAMRVSAGVNDRPIGMSCVDNSCTFSPQVLILTYDSADIMSRTDYGKGPGIIEVRYRDQADLGEGDYTLYVQIERVPAR